MTSQKKNVEPIIAGKGIQKLVLKIADEVCEREKDLKKVALVGIHTAGVPIARRIAEAIRKKTGVEPPVGTIDISLYRDDVGMDGGLPQPLVGPTALDFEIPQYTIYLVDDVLFTGRTVRAAMTAIMDLGRPRSIRLAVLLDRGHRELPIQADIVGESVKAGKNQRVNVVLKEIGGKEEEEGVYIT